MEALFSSDHNFVPYFKPIGKPAETVLEIPQFRLLQGQTLVGRDPVSDFVLNHKSISRAHARIEVNTQTGRVIIRDLNSTNGILVNGKKVRQSFLKDQDVVHIGDCKFYFCLQQLYFHPFELMEAHTPPATLPNQADHRVDWMSVIPETSVMEEDSENQQYQSAPWNSSEEDSLAAETKAKNKNRRLFLQAGSLILLLIAVGLLSWRRQKESTDAIVPKHTRIINSSAFVDQRHNPALSADSMHTIPVDLDQKIYQAYLELIKSRDRYQKQIFAQNEQIDNTLNLLSQYLPKNSALYSFFESSEISDVFKLQQDATYEALHLEAENALENTNYSLAFKNWQYLVCEQPAQNLYLDKLNETLKAAKFSPRPAIATELFKELNQNVQNLLNKQQYYCAYRLAQLGSTASTQEVGEELLQSEELWLQAKRKLEEQIKPLLEEANVYVFHQEYLPAFLLYKSAAEIYPEDSNSQNGLNALKPFLLNMEKSLIKKLEKPETGFSFLKAKTKMIALIKSSSNPLLDYPLLYNYLRARE